MMDLNMLFVYFHFHLNFEMWEYSARVLPYSKSCSPGIEFPLSFNWAIITRRKLDFERAREEHEQHELRNKYGVKGLIAFTCYPPSAITEFDGEDQIWNLLNGLYHQIRSIKMLKMCEFQTQLQTMLINWSIKA